MSNMEAIKKALEGVDLRNIDQNTNERVWLSCANEDGEHASWFDPGEGGTPYIRADLVSTTLEALQRENEEQKAWIKTATLEITKAIGGGSEMFTQHGVDFRVAPAFVASFIQSRRERHADSKKASIKKERELLARAETAEAEVKRLQAEVDRKSSMPGDHRYWEGRYRDEAAENDRLREALGALEKYADEKTAVAFRYMMDAERVGDLPFKEIMANERDAYSDMTMQLRTALASAGEEHHAE